MFELPFQSYPLASIRSMLVDVLDGIIQHGILG